MGSPVSYDTSFESSDQYLFVSAMKNDVAFLWDQPQAIQTMSFYNINGQISGSGWTQLYMVYPLCNFTIGTHIIVTLPLYF